MKNDVELVDLRQDDGNRIANAWIVRPLGSNLMCFGVACSLRGFCKEKQQQAIRGPYLSSLGHTIEILNVA